MWALTCFDTPDSFSMELDFTTIGKRFGTKINFDTAPVNVKLNFLFILAFHSVTRSELSEHK